MPEDTPQTPATQGSKTPGVKSARHDAEAAGIKNPDHDKQTYTQKEPKKPRGPRAHGNDQTKILLFAGAAADILAAADVAEGGLFTALRVGRKWFDAVDAGDKLPAHSILPTEGFVPTDHNYPPHGKQFATVEVVGKELVPYLSTAVEMSVKGSGEHGAKNHLILLNQPKAALEAAIRASYPDTALDRAGKDHKNGFTILTLKVVPAKS